MGEDSYEYAALEEIAAGEADCRNSEEKSETAGDIWAQYVPAARRNLLSWYNGRTVTKVT